MKKNLFVVCVVLLAACGGSDSTDALATASSNTPITTAPAVQPDTVDDVSKTTQGAPDEPAATAGDFGITLTIGDETWEFPSALCAYLNAPAGQDGSEWNVSRVHGDLQVYISDDSYGARVSITDIVNYGDLEWVAEGNDVTLNVDGNNITAEGTFTDAVSGFPDREGTLTATCASRHSG